MEKLKPLTFHKMREELRMTLLAEQLLGTLEGHPELRFTIRPKTMKLFLIYPVEKKLNVAMFSELLFRSTLESIPHGDHYCLWNLQKDRLIF